MTHVTQKTGESRTNIFAFLRFYFSVACKDVQSLGDASEGHFLDNASPKLIPARCSEMGLGSFGIPRCRG
ncbi:hypothetical protein SBA4_3570012 [Candidatus Sulfopaludibacter sp. SbA4]|nr:hypothetical protein SBA4_3570012 [Candidatus Sulfopaludibacter sp. SbA4]